MARDSIGLTTCPDSRYPAWPYEIASLIGSGGMREVYQAHDGRPKRTFAIKRLIYEQVDAIRSALPPIRCSGDAAAAARADPRSVAIHAHPASLPLTPTAEAPVAPPIRIIPNVDTPVPEVQMLSNARYHLFVTAAGGGYSRWQDVALTRWQEDATRDHWGSFCYLRDVETGAFWSNTAQPTRRQAEAYEAIFTEGRAEFTAATASTGSWSRRAPRSRSRPKTTSNCAGSG